MNPVYEFVDISPEALKMMGASEMDLMNEGLDRGMVGDDLPTGFADSTPTSKPKQNFMSEDFMTSSENKDDILKEILKELKDIKVILAGK